MSRPVTTYIIYKPYGMLSQFSREVETHVTLADLDYEFGHDVYPVGRLDADSEGLLILSNDKSITDRLLNPKYKQPKTYWTQVEGAPSDDDLQPLREGITIRIKKKEHKTLPAQCCVIEPPNLPERVPSIRVRQSIPDTWVELTSTEGKNRQVRRMLAAVDYPVLRLVRAEIMGYRLGEGPLRDMQPGDVVQI